MSNNQQNRRPTRRIVGPQSALTDYLASHNISAGAIASEATRRREAAAQSDDAVAESSTAAAARSTRVNRDSEANADDASTHVENHESRKKQSKAAIDKIRKSKQFKKRKRMAGSDADDDDILRELSKVSGPLPGQMDNCEMCGKRFTVTPYTVAGPDGGLLCNPCGKELAKDDAAAKKKKKKSRASGGAVGLRRKAASSLLDGTYPIGVKNLVTLCVEVLAKNIDLADDLGCLPEPVVDKIARILSKRRLVNPQTIHLFMQSPAEEVNIYDGGKLSSDDLTRIFQTTPNLRRFKVRNAVQFKDEVMDFLISRDLKLERLEVHGANLISDAKWIEYVQAKGQHLQALKILHTDRHVTDDFMEALKTHVPGLKRLKIVGNQQVSARGLREVAELKQLQHLSLRLLNEVHSDAFVHVISLLGPNLQTFSIEDVENVDNTVLDAIHANCRHLRKLRIRDSGEMTDDGFARLFTKWVNKPLEKIDFEKCRNLLESRENPDNIGMCDKGFIAMMKHSGQSLQEINLHACRHISTAAFEEAFGLGKEYPELKKAEISFIWDVTDYEIDNIFRACPKLKELNVFGCMRVKGLVRVPRGRILVGVPNAAGMIIEGRDDEDDNE